GDIIDLPGGDGLVLAQGEGGEALRVRAGDSFAVALRRGGEYCHPVGRCGGASLKKLFNEYGVPPWLRDRLPLIYRNGELAAAAGLFVCRDHCCGAGQRG